jgi:hypothetical protein
MLMVHPERRMPPCRMNLSWVRPDTDAGLRGRTMADRAGLKIVGFIFATVTLAVMFTTVEVVKSHADGSFALDGASTAAR